MVLTLNRNWKHKNDSLPIAHKTIVFDDYTSYFVHNMSDCIPPNRLVSIHTDYCDALRRVTAKNKLEKGKR